MSFKCKSCSNDCGSEYVKCHGCKDIFDFGCAGIMQSIYRKWDSSRQETWRCASCLKLKVSTTNLSIEDVVKQLKDVNDNLATLTMTMMEQNQKSEEALRIIQEQGNKIQVQQNQIEALQKENHMLKTQVQELAVQQNRLDQYGRRSNIEIHGVQHRVGENLKEIITDIGKQLQLPVDDLDVCHRLENKSRPQKRSPIIIRFKSRSVRDKWMAKHRFDEQQHRTIQ